MTVNPVRTFAFVDISGFTALTEAHGDEEAVATLARFREITHAALAPSDILVKTIGDAVMLAFSQPGRVCGSEHAARPRRRAPRVRDC